MKILSSKKNIYIFAIVLLSCELFLSIIRLTYYIYKGITIDEKWNNLTLEQKRMKYYGDEYIFFEKTRDINTNTFYLLSKDGKAYFLGRYLLYPKKIFLITDADVVKSNQYLLNFKNAQNVELLLGKKFILQDIIENDAGLTIGEVLIKK